MDQKEIHQHQFPMNDLKKERQTQFSYLIAIIVAALFFQKPWILWFLILLLL